MGRRVAEESVRVRRLGPRKVVRVDLHGISCLGPRGDHVLIRWEWIEWMEATERGVVVGSGSARITIPPGTFGRAPEALAERLRAAGSIARRAEVIEELAG